MYIIALTCTCQTESQCTEVCFASFFSGGIITAIVVNPLERKPANPTPAKGCSGLEISTTFCVPSQKVVWSAEIWLEFSYHPLNN